MQKIYIAGPSVFYQDAKERSEKYKEIAKSHGYIPLYPLDNEIDTTGKTKEMIAKAIFDANVFMIQECDIVIADLNPFRGKEPDSGTVWECGYAHGLGKRVIAYIQMSGSYLEKFLTNEKSYVDQSEIFIDNNGMIIEDFDAPLNLMLSQSIEKIVIGDFLSAVKAL